VTRSTARSGRSSLAAALGIAGVALMVAACGDSVPAAPSGDPSSATASPAASAFPATPAAPAGRTPGPLTLPDPDGWVRRSVATIGLTLAVPADVELLDASLDAAIARLGDESVATFLLAAAANGTERVGLVGLRPGSPDPILLLVGDAPVDEEGFDALVASRGALLDNLAGRDIFPGTWYGPAGPGAAYRVDLRKGPTDYQLHSLWIDLGDRAGVVAIVGPADAFIDGDVGNLAERIQASFNVLP
jgi:hypothetical protein